MSYTEPPSPSTTDSDSDSNPDSESIDTAIASLKATVRRAHRRLLPLLRAMSSAPPPSPATAKAKPAPWSPKFREHVSAMPSPEFVLATLQRAPSSEPSYLPRARYCIYRGMWASLEINSKNPSALNPALYSSDLMTFTTDVRMEKVSQIEEGGGGKGGGPVEAVWWVKEKMAQWRVKGRAYILGGEEDDDDESVKKTKEVIGRRMRLLGDEERTRLEQSESRKDKKVLQQWSWEAEIDAQFGNLSPSMRGTWKNPPPGKPVTAVYPEGEGQGLGQKLEDVHDPVARRHFRVVVIVPSEVEHTDLEDPEKARRYRWTYYEEGEGEEWRCEELWP